MKRLFFNAFVMNTSSHIHHGQWRRPDARQVDFDDVEVWIDLARTLEEARFDTMFFADVSGLYGDSDADFSLYVREGLQIPSNDPTVLLGALATRTDDIGLAVTSNVFQQHPTNFARQISTLDQISKGRVAWNIVTGTQDNGYRNFGFGALEDHDERYRWADEYVEVTYKLWEGSWDEGAVLKDKEGSVYSDPAKVHKIYHHGDRYRVEGPFLSAPSPQRTPVLFQAGSSGAGRDFAARNAEAVFITAPNPAAARAQIEETRALAVEHGRRPKDITFHQGLSFVIGATPAEAAEKLEWYRGFASADGYAGHAAVTDLNGRVYPPDTPLAAAETNGSRGRLEYLRRFAADEKTTLGEAWVRRRLDTVIVGTPAQIAEQIEAWQEVGVDGINVINWVIPGSFEEFADEVMPELRERGLAQAEYAEGTLRGKLFGTDRLPDTHPAAGYRGAFTDGPRSWAEAARSPGTPSSKSPGSR
ncbi:MAG TPA: NtaA/DmoA family FMN-dependent monooxygenase [Solirubrobacterales bacterium]|nr:NtaA/DmoA family FMN-dependent monooxygenase [Solirubrobacterales bacterium]